jgi:hypothetical protein
MTTRMPAAIAGTDTYNVTAKWWKHGWELHIDGVGVTQPRRLSVSDTAAILGVSRGRVSQLSKAS